jgi:hypothetical protein
MATRSTMVGKALAFVKKAGVTDVNLKFVDLPGRWHQVMVPASNFSEEIFARGVAFDGSSVPGFTRLESGDLGLPFHRGGRGHQGRKFHLLRRGSRHQAAVRP